MTHLLTPLLLNTIEFKIPKLKFQPLTPNEHELLLLHNHVSSLLIPMIEAPLISLSTFISPTTLPIPIRALDPQRDE